ncbi:MAG: Ig-like domain-containing protein [Gammaproteobacteria bacterium]
MRRLITCTLWVVIACGGGGSEPSVTPPAETTLALNAPPSVAVGGTLQASVAPADNATWTSEAPAIASVSNDGKITGLQLGQATIRVVRGNKSDVASIQVVAPFVDLTLGSDHACARTATRALYCWGSNKSGALGQIARAQTCPGNSGPEVACSTTPQLSESAVTFAQLSANGSGTCGLTEDGEAYCWGVNAASNPTSPARVPGGLHFTSLGVGAFFACGLDAQGRAYCWGNEEFGRLGATPIDRCGSTPCNLNPTAVVGGRTFSSLSVGVEHSCGLTAAGAAYCWGWNAFGQLGNGKVSGSEEGEMAPVQVVTDVPFLHIRVGFGHTCALTAAGDVYCWGRNGSGQLGAGNKTGSAVPVRVAVGLAFATISAGIQHTCALTRAGAAYCWGGAGNDALPGGSPVGGEIGDGTNSQRLTPTAVARNLVLVQLEANGSFTCGRVGTGQVYCWGANLSGQLGIGDKLLRSANVPVGVGGVP